MNLIKGIDSITEKLLKPWVDPRLKGTGNQLTEAQQQSMMKALQTATTKAAGDDSSAAPEIPGGELGKDVFLELLVRQIQYQDPLEPTDNADMLAQLAQFSALEQMNNLNDSFASMTSNMDQNNFITGSLLLGREISGVDVEGNAAAGIVEGVHMEEGIVYLTVGEQLVSMAGVMEIKTIHE